MEIQLLILKSNQTLLLSFKFKTKKGGFVQDLEEAGKGFINFECGEEVIIKTHTGDLFKGQYFKIAEGYLYTIARLGIIIAIPVSIIDSTVRI